MRYETHVNAHRSGNQGDEEIARHAALVALGIGTIVSGVFPESWTALATHAPALLVQ